MRRKVASSSGSRDATKSTANPSARTIRPVHRAPSAARMPSRSPAESPSAKAKTRETLTAMRFGFRASIASFSTSHCSSPHSSAEFAARAPAGPLA